MSNRNSQSLLVELQNSTATLEDSLLFYNKCEYSLIVKPSNCIPTHLKTKVHTKTYMQVFIHSHQKLETTRMSFSRWMNKHTGISVPSTPIEYYYTIKRNELPSLNKTWMHLKCILPSERNESEKVTYSWFQLCDILECNCLYTTLYICQNHWRWQRKEWTIRYANSKDNFRDEGNPMTEYSTCQAI